MSKMLKFRNFKNVPKKVVVAYIINVVLILVGCTLLVSDIFNIKFPFNAYIPAMICIIIANLINITVINKYRDVLKA
jgi:predicted tellurium resistance membrane protein TerC